MKYIFGYGSLMNRSSLKELNNVKNKNLIPVSILNLQRHLIQSNQSNSQYFSIEDKIGSITNGVIIQVTDDELKRLDLREKFYLRKKISIKRIKFNYGYDISFNKDDTVYAYYTSHDDLLRILRKAKYNKSEHTKKYIITCLKGCVEINKKFLIDFIKTTPSIYEAILDII
jgi:hypothetical protein